MFVELLMKKNGKLLFAVFLLIFIIMTGFGVSFVINNLNTTTETFIKDGYALYIGNEKNTKAETYSFTKGTSYKEKTSNKSVVFESTDGNAKVNNETIIHYADKSIGVLKKVVGLDLNTIDKNIIVYYNIYKKTNITSNNDGYNIKLANNDSVQFKNLLIRVSDNKFMLTGKNIRLVLTNEEIVDFGDYVEFEYYNGNVVKIYSNEKYYQTISSDATILVDDIKIDLKSATVYKANKRYISLTNLVINNDSNIDTLEEETKKLEINDSKVDTSGGSAGGSVGAAGGSISGAEEEENFEEEESSYKKDPIFKVVELDLTALKIDAKIEVTDEYSMLMSDTQINIIENATSKKVYEETSTMGDTEITISYADLSPDTEYTLQAIATYKKEELEYEKTFVSKIFRTEDLGVSFEKSYASESQIAVKVEKETYSKVSQVKLEIYSDNGDLINYNMITFNDELTQTVKFSGLSADHKYLVKMTDILCDSVMVEDGYAIKKNIETLKRKPVIGNLSYEVDKKNSKFVLHSTPTKDSDYGVKSYTYEVYDARKEIEGSLPVLVKKDTTLSDVSVKIDDDKILRGVPYTYRLVVEFDDNEKIIEYSKDLGQQMVLDGVEFPTVRFDTASAYITWEQINGTIIVEDPSNAIVSDYFQVIYKNSIDIYVSQTIKANTSTGNIPININGLRANETYTFQVYGTINMQDGNETESSVYIGSVFVQTKKPQHLEATYAVKQDSSKVFTVDFMLKNPENIDASLEASTLSQLKFTLYKGTTTDGAQEVYKRVMDSNDEPYISTIKHDYYDQKVVIDPSFFNRKNSDFNEEIYTLEITESYDYTKYKNEIPIKNNTFTFKVNAYIPEMPSDPNDSVIVNTVVNSSAEAFGLEYDSNLDGATTVAYYVSPKFANEELTAKKIIWHVWMYNQKTKKWQELESLKKTLEFNDNGTLDPTLFVIGNGTSQDTVDTDMLRRGNAYYFSYQITLDIDKDEKEDTLYPDDVSPNSILRGKTLYPLKETSKVKLYPSKSKTNSITYKYKIKDTDNALTSNNLKSFVEGSQTPTSTPNVTIGSEEYQEVEFTNLKQSSLYIIKKSEQKGKYTEAVDQIVQQQYFTKQVNNYSLNYSVDVDVNKLIISIDNYVDQQELIEKIASVDVIITPTKQEDIEKYGTHTIKDVKISNECIIVDFFQLYQYLAVDINVGLNVYYDSGVFGFDLDSEYVALQTVTTTGDANYFIYNESTGLFDQNSTIVGSMYNYKFNVDEGIMTLTTKDKVEKNLQVTIDNTGVMYSKLNVVPKEIKNQKLTSSDNNVRFDLIIPGVSMLNSSNKLDITSLLDSAELNAKIINLDTVDVQDDLIYIELYETDENGQNEQYLRTISETIAVFLGPVTIANLVPETNYYVKLYANVYDNNEEKYVKKYLYDIDQGIVGCKYNFYTLSKVEISEIEAKIVETSYYNKKLEVSYRLDTIYGYDRIEYIIEKKEANSWNKINVNIPDETNFYPKMKLNIDIATSKNTNVNYGGQYRITIRPVGHYVKNNETIEVDLGTVREVFNIDMPQTPYIGISASKTQMSVYYRVSVSDPNFIIVGGKYTVNFKDSLGNILAEPQEISISTINKKFEYTTALYDLVEGADYFIEITAKTDKFHDGKTFETQVAKKSITFGDTIAVGTITTAKSSTSDTAFDLIFADSYKLSSVTDIQYSISSTTANVNISNKAKFNLVYDATKQLYYYTIDLGENENFRPDNMYIIGMNFYNESQLVAQAETTYYYKE